MKIGYKLTALLCCVALMCSMLCACSTETGSTSDSAQTTVQKTINTDVNIDDNDIENSIDISTANKITLDGTTATAENNCAKVDGAFVTIENSGVYLIEGSTQNGQIKVKAQDNDTVVLVLNGVDITNTEGCAIHIKKAEKAYIVPYKSTKNVLSDTSNYEYDADDTDGEPDATLFSKSDLVISGSGTLEIDANYSSAIKGKDNVLLTDANITIDTVDDGIKGRDSLTIDNCDINVTAENTAIKTTNDEEGLGDMVLSGGNFNIDCTTDAFNCKNNLTVESGNYNINAGDDAFHADSKLNINGGDIKIESCYEGLEGQQINVTNGNININSSDDGLNSAGGNDSSAFSGGREDPFASDMNAIITISGGYIYVNADGDGIDSNGTVEMSGGTVLVDGPTNSGNGALDYASSFTCTGGLLIACGMSGMAQAVSNSSTQYCIMANLSSVSGGTLFSILDGSGTPLITYEPSKSYSNIVVCSDKLNGGETYSVSTGGSCNDSCTNGLYNGTSYSGGTTQATFTLNSIVTSNSGMGGMNSMGGMGDMGGHHNESNHMFF